MAETVATAALYSSRSRLLERWGALTGAWALAGAYVAVRLTRGWVPHDEGTLAQSAERVLQGELPHRDFDDVYTGGLSYLHAFAFWAFGTELTSLRLILLAAFLAWVPAVYYIASRVATPLVAAAATLLAVVWSVPNYTASMPSWYNLFLAVFGTAAVLRYLETERRRWLVIAGLCGGLSILVKVVGLYFVVAVVVFLLLREQRLPGARRQGARVPSPYSVFIGVVALGLVGFLLALLGQRAGSAEVAHFLVPAASLAALLLWNEVRASGRPSRERFAHTLEFAAPFLAGATAPLLVFAVPYAVSGSLGVLVHDVLVRPQERLQYAAQSPPSIVTLAFIVPFVLLLAAAVFLRRRGHPLRLALLPLGIGLALLLATSAEDASYELTSVSVRWLAVLIVPLGAVLLSRSPGPRGLTTPRAQTVLLLLCVTAFCSLLQFPFASPVYFCYVAPLVLLAALGVSKLQRGIPAAALRMLAVYVLAFAVIRVNGAPVAELGHQYVPWGPTETLALERGGIRISPAARAEYETVVALVRAHARGGFAYAGPDAPEIPFLAGLRNPTGTLYDFLDRKERSPEAFLAVLDAHGVTAVVVNLKPEFSPAFGPELSAALAARYPREASVGRFVVRWRE